MVGHGLDEGNFQEESLPCGLLLHPSVVEDFSEILATEGQSEASVGANQVERAVGNKMLMAIELTYKYKSSSNDCSPYESPALNVWMKPSLWPLKLLWFSDSEVNLSR